MNIKFQLLLLSVLFFGAGAPRQIFALSDHQVSERFDQVPNGFSRQEVPTQALTEIISLTELNEAVEIAQEGDGSFTARVKNSPESEKARAKIRTALEGRDILNLIEEQFDLELELSVYNKSRGVISKQAGPFLGAALIAALSIPSRDQFRGGRRLFFKDQNKLLTSVSLMSRETETFDNVKTNLKTAKDWSDKLGIKLAFTQQYASTEPPQQFFEWNGEDKKYQMVSNFNVRERWEAKEDASRALDDSIVAQQLKEFKAKMAPNKPLEAAAEEFLSREDISSRIYHSSGKEQQTGNFLKKAIVKFLRRKEDPNNSESFHVAKRVLGFREPVVNFPSQDVERVAFVYPDENSALRKTTARASGIRRIFDISRPSQAIPIIKKIFETSGKPVEVCLCSHGSPGSLVMASPSSSEIDLLTRETKGMVCGAYALGCSVGAQAENTSRPHLLRELSVGWGVPVSGVDQTLYLDSQKWYLQGSGRLVTVMPENQEVRSKDLIDQTPVWLEKN